MDKVSIIIPVYNVEKYLSECIESVLNQSYSNIEIILVDDGSTDRSSIICDELSKKDKRILVIHKQNGGVSAARNVGLEVASGDYILFVDSDDLIGEDYVLNLVKGIVDCDLSICGYKELYNNKINTFIVNEKKCDNNSEVINSLFGDSAVCGFLVNKLYKKDILDIYHLRLNQKIVLCEDLLFNIEYCMHVKSARFINSSEYFYRMRKSSATWNKNDYKFKNACICFDLVENILNNNNINLTMFHEYCILNLLRLSNKNLKLNNRFYKIYKNIFNSLSLKNKIKFFILMNFNFVYKFYMLFKVKNLELFD